MILHTVLTNLSKLCPSTHIKPGINYLGVVLPVVAKSWWRMWRGVFPEQQIGQLRFPPSLCSCQYPIMSILTPGQHSLTPHLKPYPAIYFNTELPHLFHGDFCLWINGRVRPHMASWVECENAVAILLGGPPAIFCFAPSSTSVYYGVFFRCSLVHAEWLVFLQHQRCTWCFTEK